MEEAAKKAEEKKKKDEEKKLEAEKKAEEERLAEEARKKAKILPDISCSFIDILFRPIETKMDTVVGSTIDPFTGRQRALQHHRTNTLHVLKAFSVFALCLQIAATSPG